MLLLKLLQQLIKTLNSDGTPGQIAAGLALGAVLGLTPLASAHNLVLFLLALIVNVSLAGVFLGWTLATPLGFALDPLFDRIGHALLGSEGLAGFWTTVSNTPVLALFNFTNTIVLGSFVAWVVALVPIYLVGRHLIAVYRERVYERLRRTKAFRAVSASKLYNLYRLFQPE